MYFIPVDFVERNDKRAFLRFEQIYTFNCLRLQSVHYVYNENCYVAQGRASIPEITEGLVTGCVDDQQSWDLEYLVGKLRVKQQKAKNDLVNSLIFN